MYNIPVSKASGVDQINRQHLENLNRFWKNIFSIKQAAKTLELPLNQSRDLLGYFARRGWLSRVRPGYYLVVPLGTANPHAYKENSWVAANTLFTPCCIGGWSAAEHWHLTEQIFSSIVVITTKAFRHKQLSIQGVKFVLKLKKKVGRTKSVWIQNTKIQVSDPAQTIVDMLDNPACGGGIRHVAELIKNYFASEYATQYDLAKYLSECGNKTTNKRLGFILESLQIDQAQLIKACRDHISTGYSMLDPSIKSKGTINRHWNLRVNAKIAP